MLVPPATMGVLMGEVIMSEARSTLTAREAEALIDLRLDKAAQEIGFTTGMMVMSLLATMPTPEDPKAHLKVIPGLQRITDVVKRRFAREAAAGFTEAVRFSLSLMQPKP